MKNLSLGGALRGSSNQAKKDAQEWEKQWDADDDDDSDDEEDVMPGRQGAPIGGHIAAGVAAATAAPPIHAMRPGMDTGHSDLGSNLSTPTSETKSMDGKPTFITPDAAVYDAPKSPSPQQRGVVSIPSSPNNYEGPVMDDDGVEWDTGYQEDVKPNVTMFLPMLRVLGKGSFGKVGSAVCIEIRLNVIFKVL
jgi:hypothetical protein